MLIDSILVIAGIVVFMIPAILLKETVAQFKVDFPVQISKFAILSGFFVSVVKILILISDFELLQQADQETISSISSTAFFIMIFVKFRPALMGILIKLILVPFSKKKNDDSINQTSKEAPFDVLSSREKEVARLAALGYSNVQIAEELYISVETVKRHLSTIFDKLNIKSRKEIKSFCCVDKSRDL